MSEKEIHLLDCEVDEFLEKIKKEVAKDIFNNLSNDKFIRDNNFGFCDLKEYAKEYGVDL